MAEIIKKPTNGKCRVCGGKIVEVISKNEFVGTGEAIYGPGGRGQWADVSKGFHCKECGIQYRFVSKSK